MAEKFKVGDWVECINTNDVNEGLLVHGMIYKVLDIDDYYLSVRDDDQGTSWHHWRFERTFRAIVEQAAAEGKSIEDNNS